MQIRYVRFAIAVVMAVTAGSPLCDAAEGQSVEPVSVAGADDLPALPSVRPALMDDLLGTWRLDIDQMLAVAQAEPDFPTDPMVAAPLLESMTASLGLVQVTIRPGVIVLSPVPEQQERMRFRVQHASDGEPYTRLWMGLEPEAEIDPDGPSLLAQVNDGRVLLRSPSDGSELWLVPVSE